MGRHIGRALLTAALLASCGKDGAALIDQGEAAPPLVAECAADSDCPLGRICTEGACALPGEGESAPGCRRDDDCGMGEACLKSNGSCVLVKLPDPVAPLAQTSAVCEPGAMSSCGSSKLGECRLGTSTCVETITGWNYGACEGAAGPTNELCDGKDNDCDGLTDDGIAAISCGVGACARTVPGCANGVAGTCLPGTPVAETCDGVDNDCDGQVDEGIAALQCGVGACARTVPACTAGQPSACVPGLPRAETCNGLDDDCDGAVDENLTAQTCGLGVCARTAAACSNGQPIACTPGSPSAESCDGLDNDCDGQVDEGCNCLNGQTRACYTGPSNTQNVGVCRGGTQTCVGGNWAACTGEVRPGTESCNGSDDDCDGSTDEALGNSSCGAGACRRTVAACSGGAPLTCSPGTPSAESCDGVDNDCDGTVDDGVCGPVSSCPANQTVNPNTTVPLNTTVSSPSGRPVTCAWSVVSRPGTSSGTFTNPTSCSGASYQADVVGAHVLRFTVTDSLGLTSTCDVTITVNPLGDLWVELTWNRANDMDLHLLHPSAGNSHTAGAWSAAPYDCAWDDRNPSWDAPGTADDPSLDRDDISGTGPENIRINVPSVSHSYTIGAHMFSYFAAPQSVTATAKIYCGGVLKQTLTRSYSVDRQLWVIGTVQFGTSGTGGCTFTSDGYVFTLP
jgi:Putative metal-binding motif